MGHCVSTLHISGEDGVDHIRGTTGEKSAHVDRKRVSRRRSMGVRFQIRVGAPQSANALIPAEGRAGQSVVNWQGAHEEQGLLGKVCFELVPFVAAKCMLLSDDYCCRMKGV